MTASSTGGFDAQDYVREVLRGYEPYDPAFTPCRVNLSSNENTHEPPAALRSAMAEAAASTPLNRYPDPMANRLRDLLAERHGVSRDAICVGNGGDELLFNLLFCFGGPGHKAVTCPPDFSEYRNFAAMCGTPCEAVWRDPESFSIDADALVEAASDATMVILTTPNNPTGDLLDPVVVRRLLDETDALVLIDEAYIEFAGEDRSFVGWIAGNPRLMVLRTLSKAFGLAGLRVGYLVSDPGVVDVLASVRQVYSEDVVAQAVAEVVIEHRGDLDPIVADIASERDRVSAELGSLPGVRTWPSSSNFVLARVAGAHGVWLRLRDEFSVLVRDFSSVPGIEDCLRIAVGTREENDALIDAMRAITQEEA